MQIANHQADMKFSLGSKIRAERNLRGWSQDELAERTTLHRNTIGEIERCKDVDDLKPQYAVLLAWGFGMIGWRDEGQDSIIGEFLRMATAAKDDELIDISQMKKAARKTGRHETRAKGS